MPDPSLTSDVDARGGGIVGKRDGDYGTKIGLQVHQSEPRHYPSRPDVNKTKFRLIGDNHCASRVEPKTVSGGG